MESSWVGGADGKEEMLKSRGPFPVKNDWGWAFDFLRICKGR
jgi:hypothetical protein